MLQESPNPAIEGSAQQRIRCWFPPHFVHQSHEGLIHYGLYDTVVARN